MAARPLAGQWQLFNDEDAFVGYPWYAPVRRVTVGVPAPRKDDAGKYGSNLIYDNYPGYSDDNDDDSDSDDAMDTSAKLKRDTTQPTFHWNESSGQTSAMSPLGQGIGRMHRRDLLQGTSL